MGILEELFKISTGMEQKMRGQSLNETSMDVNYPEDTQFTQAGMNQGKPFRIEQPTGELTDIQNRLPIRADQPSNGIVPPPKPNAISELGKNPALFQNIFGLDFATMQKNWQDKGGFEGLMANPAFMLGLGIIQSSAQGKSIGSDLLNNAVKAGAISAQYADRIKNRATVLGPITDAQREEVRAVLAESDLAETADISTKIKNFFKGKKTDALNRRALDDVANRAARLAKIESKQKGGQEVRMSRKHIEQAVKDLKREGKIAYGEKGFLDFFFGRGIQSTAPGLAKGGPVTQGKNYIVGEEGPEMFVPEVDGNIINNDDSKVINMLLESNPQLKNVSRARAVKILKARFPDYF